MPRRKNNRNEEAEIIDKIDDKALWDEIGPVIKKAIKLGGGAQEVLSKAQSVAAQKMLELMYDDKSDIRFRAAKEILDRSIGKAVERKVSIYGDINQMNEREIDNEIKRLLEDADGGAVLDAIIDHKAKKSRRKLPKTTKELIPTDVEE